MRQGLLRVARSPAGGWLVRFALRYFNRFLPVERVEAGPGWIAFRHPAPSNPVHLLILPLPPVNGLADLTETEAGKLGEVFRLAAGIAGRLGLAPGWRLVINGGRFQEVAIAHFHLISSEHLENPI